MRQRIAAHQHRVPCPLLFGLLDEANAGAGHRLPHLFGLVAHHREDSLGRSEFQRRIDDVLQKRLSSGFMQYLGLAALHARAESGSENHNRYGLVHYYYYACLRRRPSWASFITTAAVALGS